MKLFPAHQIKSIEKSGINRHIYSSLELMNQAAETFVNWFTNKVGQSEKICCVCGLGNNGADGLVIGEKLILRGFDVHFLVVRFSDLGSEEFEHHFARITALFPELINIINRESELPSFTGFVVIDGLFGNGLNRPLKARYDDLVNLINSTSEDIYAIDIPSGLPAEGVFFGPAIKAKESLSFEFPKLSFFHSENEPYVGNWSFRSIGLDRCDIESNEGNHFLIQQKMISGMKKTRAKFSHKGTFGHVHLMVGDSGMAGAGIMAAKAALVSGCGLCSVSTTETNRTTFQSHIPEAMMREWSGDWSDFNQDLKMTFGVGPGVGQSEEVKGYLFSLLTHCKNPIVLDADAINILAQNKRMIREIPVNSIITPHLAEFERLAGLARDSEQRLKLQLQFSSENQMIVVLKGHHTSITCPDGRVYFNNTGNPGMATGGSGDVLTGMITSFLAQGYLPIEASLLGVYLHGLAGDLAMSSRGMESLTALDIIDHIHLAINSLN